MRKWVRPGWREWVRGVACGLDGAMKWCSVGGAAVCLLSVFIKGKHWMR